MQQHRRPPSGHLSSSLPNVRGTQYSGPIPNVCCRIQFLFSPDSLYLRPPLHPPRYPPSQSSTISSPPPPSVMHPCCRSGGPLYSAMMSDVVFLMFLRAHNFGAAQTHTTLWRVGFSTDAITAEEIMGFKTSRGWWPMCIVCFNLPSFSDHLIKLWRRKATYRLIDPSPSDPFLSVNLGCSINCKKAHSCIIKYYKSRIPQNLLAWNLGYQTSSSC